MNKLVPVSTYLTAEDEERLRNMSEHASKYLRKILGKYGKFDTLEVRVTTDGIVGALLYTTDGGFQTVNETKYESGWNGWASQEVDDDNSGSN